MGAKKIIKNISDADDKVGMEKNEKKLEQNGSASEGFSIQSQEETITAKQPDTTNMEESETVGILREKVQYVIDRDIEILDSRKTIEQSSEPKLSTATNDEAQEYHIQDKQKVGEENKEVQGEELPVCNDVVVSKLDNKGKKHNVEVEQKHVENFEMQGKEPVPNDITAPVNDEPGDSSKSMVARTAEAATTKIGLPGEKELGLGEGEDHSTYPSTCDALEGNNIYTN